MHSVKPSLHFSRERQSPFHKAVILTTTTTREITTVRSMRTVTKVVGLLTIAMEATHTATTMVMMDTEVRGTPLV